MERVFLTETYNEASTLLWNSLQASGCCEKIVVLEENGFLPEGVQSAYGYFLGDFKAEAGEGCRPVYFNEIEVPKFWRISATDSGGSVHNLHRECAKIYFAKPQGRRYVRLVEWKDENGVVRFGDHYNQYGFLYARTVMDAGGHRINRTYFDTKGHVKIEENFVTKAVILTEGEKITVFPNKVKFLQQYAKLVSLQDNVVLYNSLSTPYFLVRRLEESAGEAFRSILIWQEEKREDIPGNMQQILNNNRASTQVIYVQNRPAYDKLLELGAAPERVKPLDDYSALGL